MPARCLNISPAKCVPLPVPAEANLTCPGLALASAISSGTDLTLSEGGTTSR
jgi:hypothetical protein